MKEFILETWSITEQGIIDPQSSLYNQPHSGPYTLTICSFLASDRFITTMVDIDPYGAW